MLEIEIPGRAQLALEHLVLDFNGTLAHDGKLIPGVGPLLNRLSNPLHIHVITADTFGNVAAEIAALPCRLAIIPQQRQDAAKLEYINRLDPDRVVAVGNGRNDRLMLEHAALGMAVAQREGAATAAILAADLTLPDINAALELLLRPKGLIATLRN